MRFIRKTQIGWVSRLLILSLLLGLAGMAFASVPRATAAPVQASSPRQPRKSPAKPVLNKTTKTVTKKSSQN